MARPIPQNQPELITWMLTYGRPHGHDDAVARVLDEVDDLPVVEGADVHVVHRQDAVAHVQTPVRWN